MSSHPRLLRPHPRCRVPHISKRCGFNPFVLPASRPTPPHPFSSRPNEAQQSDPHSPHEGYGLQPVHSPAQKRKRASAPEGTASHPGSSAPPRCVILRPTAEESRHALGHHRRPKFLPQLLLRSNEAQRRVPHAHEGYGLQPPRPPKTPEKSAPPAIMEIAYPFHRNPHSPSHSASKSHRMNKMRGMHPSHARM